MTRKAIRARHRLRKARNAREAVAADRRSQAVLLASEDSRAREHPADPQTAQDLSPRPVHSRSVTRLAGPPQSSLSSLARATALGRVATSSLRKMLLTCVLTVLTET